MLGAIHQQIGLLQVRSPHPESVVGQRGFVNGFSVRDLEADSVGDPYEVLSSVSILNDPLLVRADTSPFEQRGGNARPNRHRVHQGVGIHGTDLVGGPLPFGRRTGISHVRQADFVPYVAHIWR